MNPQLIVHTVAGISNMLCVRKWLSIILISQIKLCPFYSYSILHFYLTSRLNPQILQKPHVTFEFKWRIFSIINGVFLTPNEIKECP